MTTATDGVLSKPATSKKRVRNGRMIVRYVYVDYSKSLPDAIQATGRERMGDSDEAIGEIMPGGVSGMKKVCIFCVGREMDDGNLEQEYQEHRLKPADLHTHLALNEERFFANGCPNSTKWQNGEGEWCSSSCFRSNGCDFVEVKKDEDAWPKNWSFVGVEI